MLEKEDQPIKDNANQLELVMHQDNTMVSGILPAVVHADIAHKDQDTSLELTDQDATESERPATASPVSTKMSGIASDAQLDKEDQETKELVKPLPHVPDHSSITVSGIPKTVVPVDTANKDQDGLSELIDQDVTDQSRSVTASHNSTRTSGIASDAQLAKEDLLIKDNANQLDNVTELTSTMVSGILPAVVHADIAHKDQDTSLEPTDPDAIESERPATAFPVSMRTSGIASDAQ